MLLRLDLWLSDNSDGVTTTIGDVHPPSRPNSYAKRKVKSGLLPEAIHTSPAFHDTRKSCYLPLCGNTPDSRIEIVCHVQYSNGINGYTGWHVKLGAASLAIGTAVLAGLPGQCADHARARYTPDSMVAIICHIQRPLRIKSQPGRMEKTSQQPRAIGSALVAGLSCQGSYRTGCRYLPDGVAIGIRHVERTSCPYGDSMRKTEAGNCTAAIGVPFATSGTSQGRNHPRGANLTNSMIASIGHIEGTSRIEGYARWRPKTGRRPRTVCISLLASHTGQRAYYASRRDSTNDVIVHIRHVDFASCRHRNAMREVEPRNCPYPIGAAFTARTTSQRTYNSGKAWRLCKGRKSSYPTY